MMSAGSAIAVGLLAAGLTTVYVTVTVSPTFGAVLSTVIAAVVVPSIGGMPATAGGMQCVGKSTFVDAPAGQASAPPVATASAVTPSSDAQRRLRDVVAMAVPPPEDGGHSGSSAPTGGIDVGIA